MLYMSTLQRKQVKGQKQHLNILWGRGPRKINTPFYKAFVIKPFQILCPVLTSISRENIIEIPLTSKKRQQAKFCLVDAWSKAFLFTGEISFSSRFFFSNPEIYTQIPKPTKY